MAELVATLVADDGRITIPGFGTWSTDNLVELLTRIGLPPDEVEIATVAAAVAAVRTHLAADAPAPLDPGNPEHLRQVAEFVRAYNTALGHYAVDDRPFDARADRLDREQRESEQDRKDRELATEIAKTERHDFGLLAESYREEILRHILAGIRAGRAERQEAGQ